ncbi:MAG: HAD family hydrolase [Burkholderiaceae bacterium]|nr:HAD family hydrolase [Burkholderiaceae bacterium]
MLHKTLDISRVKAITLDLDNTLWSIWPTVERSEAVLQNWLATYAPATHTLYAQSGTMRTIRQQLSHERPDLLHDLSALRRELIRRALLRAGDSPALAEPAFEVFFAERQRVDLFDDVLPALKFLSDRFPVVALSNGNADVRRIGLGRYFHASVSASDAGAAKPDVRIFQRGAQVAGVPVTRVLHIGHDPHLDGAGALGAGMQMAWINRMGLDWTHTTEPHVAVANLSDLCKLMNRLQGVVL